MRKTIAIDENGIMKANLAVQELDRLTMRVSYGTPTSAYTTKAVAIGSNDIHTITGKGMILGGHIAITAAASAKNSTITLVVDGTLFQGFTFYNLNLWSLNQMYNACVYERLYDDVNFIYVVGLPFGWTFESSIVTRAIMDVAGNAYGVVYYAEV